MEIITKKTADLKPYSNNAKIHDEVQVANVAESIKQFGWKQPIVVDGNDVIIIGHCRWMAAKKLGLKEVPVLVADDLTEEEAARLRLVDNKSNESPWDYELLDTELEIVDLDGFEFDFGFESYLDNILNDDFTTIDAKEEYSVTLNFPLEYEDIIREYISENTKAPLNEAVLKLVRGEE